MTTKQLEQYVTEKYDKEMLIWEMLLDNNRTNSYIKYIKENVKGKVVVECGTGTGFFSWLSAKYGAKKVYSCEQSINLFNKLKERFNSIEEIEVVHCDVFSDDLPKGDIYLHELFGHCALGEGIMLFLLNCKRQNIENIQPRFLNLVSCNLKDNFLNKVPVTKETYDASDLDYDLRQFFDINNKEIDPNSLLFNNEYNIDLLSNKEMFSGDIFKLLELDYKTNSNTSYTYFEAGFSLDNFYSSFAKKQNHWEIDKQQTVGYTNVSRLFLKDINLRR